MCLVYYLFYAHVQVITLLISNLVYGVNASCPEGLCKNGGTCYQTSEFYWNEGQPECLPDFYLIDDSCYAVKEDFATWCDSFELCRFLYPLSYPILAGDSNAIQRLVQDFLLPINETIWVTTSNSKEGKQCDSSTCPTAVATDAAIEYTVDACSQHHRIVCQMPTMRQLKMAIPMCACPEPYFGIYCDSVSKLVKEVDHGVFTCPTRSESTYLVAEFATTYSNDDTVLSLMRSRCQGLGSCNVTAVEEDLKLVSNNQQKLQFRLDCYNADTLQCPLNSERNLDTSQLVRCFYVLHEYISWHEARDRCRHLGGELASTLLFSSNLKTKWEKFFNHLIEENSIGHFFWFASEEISSDECVILERVYTKPFINVHTNVSCNETLPAICSLYPRVNRNLLNIIQIVVPTTTQGFKTTTEAAGLTVHFATTTQSENIISEETNGTEINTEPNGGNSHDATESEVPFTTLETQEETLETSQTQNGNATVYSTSIAINLSVNTDDNVAATTTEVLQNIGITSSDALDIETPSSVIPLVSPDNSIIDKQTLKMSVISPAQEKITLFPEIPTKESNFYDSTETLTELTATMQTPFNIVERTSTRKNCITRPTKPSMQDSTEDSNWDGTGDPTGKQCNELHHDSFKRTLCVLQHLKLFTKNITNFEWIEALPTVLLTLQERIIFLLNHNNIEEAADYALAILDNLLKEELVQPWKNVNDTYRPLLVSIVFELIELIGLKYAETFAPNTHRIVRMTKLEMRIYKQDIDTEFTFSIRDEWKSGRINVKTEKPEKNITASLYYFHDISHLITAFHSKNSFRVHSGILGLAMSSESEPKSAKITFRKNNLPHQPNESICVFWNDSKADDHYFDSTGCWLLESHDDLIICECNHLTTFAVLTNWKNIELRNNRHLKVLTMVGCGLSTFGLLACITIFTVARSLWSTKTTMHNNLCLCLLTGNVTLLIGLKFYNDRLTCVIVAAILHFSYLAAFMWMLLEGVSIFRAVMTVFSTDTQRMMGYYLLAYGISISVVAMTIWIANVLNTSYISTDGICWLNSENHMIWAFLGPAACIIAINLVVLGLALKKAQSLQAILRKKQLQKVKVVARGIAVLSPILGVTWICGFLFINDHLIVFAYMFTILNSLQGLFIFIFHFWMNKKLRNIILNPDIILKANELKNKMLLRRNQSRLTSTSLSSDPVQSTRRPLTP